MARSLADKRLDSRTGRLKLKQRREPYWRKLTNGLHLGYRRNKSGGSWVARWRRSDRCQQYHRLGTADDVLDADGLAALSFEQAQRKARDWFQNALALSTHGRVQSVYTVSDCVADYLKWARQHRKWAAHMQIYANAFILSQLGHLDTATLTSTQLRQWQEALAAEPPRVRSRAGRGISHRVEHPDPDEAQRRRRLRANRMLTLLRAALNRAWREGLITTGRDEWLRLELYKSVERQRENFLSRDQAARLINVCQPDLRRLAQLALLTGGRYSELAGFEVRDYHGDSGTLLVRKTKRGKSRRIVLNDEGIRLCDQLVVGRRLDEPLLIRADGNPWFRDHHCRPFKEAVKQAGLVASFTFHELRHTWASLAIMNGTPLMVVAQNLGHADTRMVERHYGHLANSYLVEQIRERAPKYGFGDENNISKCPVKT